MKKLTRFILITLSIIAIICIIFRIFCGIFVIQPIGAIPEGTTIIYWRSGIDLPFIASADGLLEQSGQGVSIFGRMSMLSKYAIPVKEKEIFRFGYSEKLYLISTNGKQYDR